MIFAFVSTLNIEPLLPMVADGASAQDKILAAKSGQGVQLEKSAFGIPALLAGVSNVTNYLD